MMWSPAIQVLCVLFRMCFDTYVDTRMWVSPLVQFDPPLTCACTHQHTHILKMYAEVIVHAFSRILNINWATVC